MTGILLVAVGLVALVVGAELLVRGAVRLATALGMSPLVIGLTVVAFGTSAPELAASGGAALAGAGELAMGNVVGSNIFNVLVILGVSAMAAPLVVAARVVRLDVPVMLAVSATVTALALDGRIGRLEGLGMLVVVVGHTTWMVVAARREGGRTTGPESEGLRPSTPTRAVASAVLVVAGLVVLVLGARWLVTGSVAVARAFEISERVIGLTVVAAGTSMPELATSVVAAIRGQRDIAVGNVVGSNLFNLTAVLGTAAAIAGDGLVVSPRSMGFDLPVMLVAAAACLPVCLTGFEISRREGLVFVVGFGWYLATTVTVAVGRSLPVVVHGLLGVGLAMVVAASVVASIRQLRR